MNEIMDISSDDIALYLMYLRPLASWSAFELAGKHRLPAMYPYRDYVEAGGLMAYAVDLAELLRRMADDVHQILKGSKPGDIPIYQPTKLESPDQPEEGNSARPHAVADTACPRCRDHRIDHVGGPWVSCRTEVC